MDEVTPPDKQPAPTTPPPEDIPDEPTVEPKDITNDPEIDSAVDEINKKDSDTLLTTTEPKVRKSGPWYKRILTNKKIIIPAAIVIVLAIVLAVPLTRYKIAGLFWKQTYTLTVDDDQTGQPVTAATVTLAGKTATTNNHGVAKLHVRVGNATLSITKKYYATTTKKVLVPIHDTKSITFKLHATGRPVPVRVVNKITGQPIENAAVNAASTDVQTDQNGEATIVLPTNSATVSASISATGYNTSSTTIQVTSQTVSANTFQLTPTGKVYFLSNLSGTEDVVATNLDGTDRQVILAGTGTEDQNNTNLYASSDWQFLVLQAKRDTVANSNSLYIIATASSSLLTLDKGNVTFTPIGWLGHYFIYDTTRNDLQPTDSGYEQLKSYDADSGQIKVLDQSQVDSSNGSPVDNDQFSNFNLVNNEVTYSVEWSSSVQPANFSGHSDFLEGIQPNGQGQKDLTTFDPAQIVGMNVVQYSPTGLYIDAYDNNGNDTYYVFAGDSVKSSSITNSTFYQGYPSYEISPSGNQTFWSTQRDGKNTLFVGDANGNSGKQIASLSDYDSYGWFTDNYLLVTKQNELYIMPVGGGTALKIADYQYIPSYGE